MFTPAPWCTEIKYHKNGLGSSCKILAGFIPGDTRRLVATINSKNPLAYGNSNVLVAAPDLLSACETILPFIEDRGMEGETDFEKAVLKLKAAVDRAKGGQS
jgi:hypothetical protein